MKFESFKDAYKYCARYANKKCFSLIIFVWVVLLNQEPMVW